MSLVWRLVSSDRGVVRHVVAAPGDVIEMGDTLAVLTTTADEDPGGWAHRQVPRGHRAGGPVVRRAR